MMNNLFRKKKGQRGQAFLELALSLVFLLILLAAVIDLGWAFYTVISLRDAAQEAASFGSICPTDEAKILDRLRKSANAPLNMEDIDTADIEICIVDPDPAAGRVCGAPIELGNSVRVTVTIQHKILTPFVGSFIGDQWEYPLSVNVSDTILRTTCYE
jgi:Flp pilus assembly protein TadG